MSVLCAGLVVVRGALAGQQLTPTERATAVATIWAEARYNFAYWDRVRADWDSALGANLKLAAEPQSDLAFYRRLRRLLAVLGDGNAAVTLPPYLRSRLARPPLRLETVERRPFILDYAENDEMRIARPERLSEILAVQGVPAETWVRDSILPEITAATAADRWRRAIQWMLEGEKGTSLHLLIRVPGGEQRGISVTRSVSLNDRWPFTPPELELDSLPGGVAVVRVNSLADEEVARRFDRAFPDFARVTGLILDLRAAVGGKSESGYQILARLEDKPFLVARWKTPEYRAAFRAWRMADSVMTWYGPPADTVRPRTDRPTYTGPLAVLASTGTAGAAEDFLVAFRTSGRGMTVGEPSAGTPGDVAPIQLPKSWAVQFSVTRHTFPDGTEFFGAGVKPEIPVTQPVGDFLAGRDAVLERAREYLKTVEGGRGR